MKITLSCALAILASALCFGDITPRRWAYLGSYSATGTSIVVTVKNPSTSKKVMRAIGAMVSCPSAACTLTPSVGGTEATATLGTLTRTRTLTPLTPSSLFYAPSNVSGATSMPSTKIGQTDGTAVELLDFEALPGEQVNVTLASSSSQVLGLLVKVEEFPCQSSTNCR